MNANNFHSSVTKIVIWQVIEWKILTAKKFHVWFTINQHSSTTEHFVQFAVQKHQVCDCIWSLYEFSLLEY